MIDAIVVHYGEIGIKGANREKFERQLIRNLQLALKNQAKVLRYYGRIVCNLKENANLEKIKEKLSLMPGIEYFAFAIKTSLDLKKIEQTILKIAKEKNFTTFKIETQRSNKAFPLTSIELNKRLGALIVDKLGKKVKMKNQDITFYVEITEKNAFIYTEKIKGVGGLPVGVSGKVVALVSGGIDSPVASFLMMKRGCKVIVVHFYNKTINTQASLEKIKKIAKRLANIQLSLKLYLVPFKKIQKEIIKQIPAKQRMIVYRRFMHRIAERIAKKENAKALVTGDSIGQVASQTLQNINVIYEVNSLPVFAPLIGMNKMETVELAKKIKTYEYSILPYEDCCSFMIAPHPETHADLTKIKKLEESLEVEKLVEEAFNKAEIIEYKA